MKKLSLVMCLIVCSLSAYSQSIEDNNRRLIAKIHKNQVYLPIAQEACENVTDLLAVTNQQKATLSSKTYLLEEVLLVNAQEGTNEVDSFQRYEFEYNESGLRISLLFSNYSNDAWIKQAKEEYNYTADDSLSVFYRYDWTQSTQAWFLCIKREHFRDESGRILRLLVSHINPDSDEWQPALSYDYTYDEFGRMASKTTGYWQDAVFMYLQKFEYYYDDAGRLIEVHDLSTMNNVDWTIGYIYIYTYDENDMPVRIETKYNHDSLGWIAQIIEGYSYDNELQLVAFLRWELNNETVEIDTENMDLKKKIEYDYDEIGNITASIISYFDDVTGELETSYKDTFLYDLNYEVNQTNTNMDLFKQPEGIEAVVNLPMGFKYYEWNAENNAWEIEYIGSYKYKNLNVGIEINANEQGTELYPNPATDVLYFGFQRPVSNYVLDIYSIKGQLLKQVCGTGSVSANVRELRAGSYFYVLKSEGQVFKGQFMVGD